MNDYCILLDTQIQPLIDGIDVTTQTVKQTIVSPDKINPALLEWMDSLGIMITLAEIFHWPAGQSGGVHVDTEVGDHTKLNWVYGGAGSITQWFKKKNTSESCQYDFITPVKTPAVIFDKKMMEVIHEQHIEGPCVLQVGVPHQVNNSDIEGRWTLCFVLRYKDYSYISMEETRELFKPFIKAE